ncbi:hypothetical protein L484_002303 [Morus notabilis]|uniref:Uncharacterized protein n=1 Tax=Morus notabilis TaxID=981085 RepID=W9QS83_9ROSA|nr:hypothetical protein L484_002303 [Morus notabilis]
MFPISVIVFSLLFSIASNAQTIDLEIKGIDHHNPLIRPQSFHKPSIEPIQIPHPGARIIRETPGGPDPIHNPTTKRETFARSNLGIIRKALEELDSIYHLAIGPISNHESVARPVQIHRSFAKITSEAPGGPDPIHNPTIRRENFAGSNLTITTITREESNPMLYPIIRAHLYHESSANSVQIPHSFIRIKRETPGRSDPIPNRGVLHKDKRLSSFYVDLKKKNSKIKVDTKF